MKEIYFWIPEKYINLGLVLKDKVFIHNYVTTSLIKLITESLCNAILISAIFMSNPLVKTFIVI